MFGCFFFLKRKGRKCRRDFREDSHGALTSKAKLKLQLVGFDILYDLERLYKDFRLSAGI